MARDFTIEIDKLGEQLADLRSVLVKQAGHTADDASAYLGPRAKHLAERFRREGYGLSKAARRHPSAATGVVIGAAGAGGGPGVAAVERRQSRGFSIDASSASR